MKKTIVIFFAICSQTLFSAGLFHDYGINLGINTMKLLGNLSSVQPQILRNNSNSHPGGGLQFIAPGIDLSLTVFIDSSFKHRLIIGGEYIGLESREISSISSFLYAYKQHTVGVLDFFAGYHYSFFAARFQAVKVYAGGEIMFNNILKNKSEVGLKYLKYPENNESVTDSKAAEHRFGARIRLGFEGKLYKKLYINTSFSVGAYNVLARNNLRGELFNSKNGFETKESIQPFFNYLLSLQYRFNSTSDN